MTSKMQRRRAEVLSRMKAAKGGGAPSASKGTFATSPPKKRKSGAAAKAGKSKFNPTFLENTGKGVPRGAGVYGRPDARAEDEEEEEEDDAEKLGDEDEGPVAKGYASDDNQYNVRKQLPEPTQQGQGPLVGVNEPPLGTYGNMSEREAGGCDAKVKL